MQRRRIDTADLDDRAKQLILRGNAERLLNLPIPLTSHPLPQRTA